jgi:hypothetical protein
LNRGCGVVLVLAIMGAGTVTAMAAPLNPPALPEVSVPSVPVPEVSAPSVPVPEVSVPSVPAPAPVPLPAPAPVPVPALPPVPAVQVAAPPAGSATRNVGPTVEAVAERAASTGASVVLGPRLDGRAPTAERRREAQRRRRAARATIERLRRRLRPVRHCLHVLPGKSRRTLRLHLGLGEARPRSRQAVARRMGTSWWRVRRIERRSLVQLRRADRAGACESSGAGTTTAFGLADTGIQRLAVAAVDVPAPPDVPPAGQGGVRGAGESGTADGENGGGDASSPGRSGRRGPIGLVDSATDDLQTLALILAVLLLAGFAVGLLARLRRPRGSAQ